MTTNQLRAFCEQGSRRIGILGGTFDPVHSGHIKLCKAAMSEFSLDCVLLLVSGQPPHKGESVSNKEIRFKMCELVASNEDGICASRIELDRQGSTYTADTLRALHEALPNDVSFFYIIGTDTLLNLRTWARPEEVFALTNFICFSRPGLDDGDVANYVRLRLRGYSGRIYFGREKGPEVSSTDIRRRIAQSLTASELIPSYIEEFIMNHGLYKQAALSFDEVAEMIKNEISEKRYQHTLGVIESIEKLAIRYEISLKRARWAALLHDCAKGMSEEEMLKECGNYDVLLDEFTRREPNLIHAPLGAAIAKMKYGMQDELVLQAIACHTTGRKNMLDLDKILYLADLIEKNRDYEGVSQLREIAEENLDNAVIAGMDQTIRHVLDTGSALHPDTVIARNYLLYSSEIE